MVTDLVTRLRDDAYVLRDDLPATADLLREAADALEAAEAAAKEWQAEDLVTIQNLTARAEKAERALREIRDIPFASGAVGLIASAEAVRRMLLTASRALGSAAPDKGSL